MASMNLMPGIHNVKIHTDNSENNYEVSLCKKKDNELHVSFSLTGLNKLKEPINKKLTPFYLYVLLSYHDGGKDINIISSADVYCDEQMLRQHNIHFKTTVDIPVDFVFDDEDFIWNYYCLDIVYSPISAEDGSDLYRLLRSDKLFSTKLSICRVADESDE